jgi:gamma-glutamyltranspeptidase/glutathione hydrolase
MRQHRRMRPDDLLRDPHPLSRRTMVGRRGAVATSQPVAAQAGMWVLQQGGTAVDAAIATAAALTVVEPTSNGIGSDAFALLWAEGSLHGLNGSGPAPASLTPDAVRSAGHGAMPELGWLPVTVPGAVGAWAALHARFGRLPFEQVLAPAIELAEDGFALTPVVARSWALAERGFDAHRGDPALAGWFATFLPGGRSPSVGEIVRFPDHAATLREIARSGGASFTGGRLAEAIGAFAAATGGHLRADDLAAHRPEWVSPISTSYRGVDVWEIPPNGQGITALTALNILEGFDADELTAGDGRALHLQIEAMKLAFADAAAWVADPRRADVPVPGLLDKAYAATRRTRIGESAAVPTAGEPPRGGTVYLCTADRDGSMVSFIQSNYQGFGSGVVVPGTGIALQNRGAGFSLDPAHPNVLAPGKRPYHTIIPGFLTRDGAPLGPFGVMGGFMQPQGHVQVVLRTVDEHLGPQAVLDAPRWRWEQGTTVWVEPRFPDDAVAELGRRGHDVRIVREPSAYGRGQIIRRHGSALLAGSESRADGQALVW